MTITVTPHLNFNGQARAALDFYHSVFGGEQRIMTYVAMGAAEAARHPDHVVWGQVASPEGFRIMAFDVRASQPYDSGANAFFVSMRSTSPERVRALWEGLSAGGQTVHDLAPAPWTALYGMLTDRFGITWILDVEPGAASS